MDLVRLKSTASLGLMSADADDGDLVNEIGTHT
jgi:hypothetical protein